MALGKSGRWRGRGELSLLVMREVAQPSKSRVLTSLKQFLRGTCCAEPHTSPGTSLHPEVGRLERACVVPSRRRPSRHDSLARGRNELPGSVRSGWEHRWFGVLGALASRKNIPLVCAALSSIETRGIGLLLAGSIDDDARESVEAAVRSGELSGVKVIWMDKLLTDRNWTRRYARWTALSSRIRTRDPVGSWESIGSGHAGRRCRRGEPARRCRAVPDGDDLGPARQGIAGSSARASHVDEATNTRARPGHRSLQRSNPLKSRVLPPTVLAFAVPLVMVWSSSL